MHFVIIIFSYLALIRLRFVELGFRQIKRKYIQYNTIQFLHLLHSLPSIPAFVTLIALHPCISLMITFTTFSGTISESCLIMSYTYNPNIRTIYSSSFPVLQLLTLLMIL